MRILAVLGAVLLMVLTQAAAAREVALVIGNRDYARGEPVRDADDIFRAVFRLRQAGFDVISGRDVELGRMDGLTGDLADALEQADRVVVLLAGQVVRSSRDAYFMPVDGDARSPMRLSRSGLSLGLILDLVSQKPGGAVVGLATQPGADFDIGPGLAAGIGGLEPPQGVTLVSGLPGDVAGFVSDLVTAPGLSLDDALSGAGRALDVRGYRSGLHGFLGGPSLNPEALREEGWWDAARTMGTAEALEAYLNRYPGGAFARDANTMLDDLRNAPLRDAEASERALGLDRGERRALQRALVLLGYDPRGIDGIFGRGTRSAVTKFQTDNRLLASGFFDRETVALLNDLARARTAELEAEAAAHAAEEARQEEALWRRVTRQDTVASYRNYLDRYPDGSHVDEARARLRDIRGASARAEERAFWDEVVSANTVAAYRSYLQTYPDGAFVEDAQAALAEIEQAEGNQAAIDAAAAEESRVLSSRIMRMLAERRLDELGLEPGRVDGQFNDRTRRAIRRYQQARDLPVTGYVDQATAVRMLAGAL